MFSSFGRMISGMQMVTMRHMSMISCLLIVSGGIMFGCLSVMISRVLMMLRRCLMMLNGLMMIVFTFWHKEKGLRRGFRSYQIG
jgi:hypothetical protein